MISHLRLAFFTLVVTGFLLAFCTTITAQELISITSVRASYATGETTVRIRAAQTITSFQRPERTPEGFVLRLPSAMLNDDALDSSVSWGSLRCTIERIRDIVVMRFHTNPTDSVSIKRDGPRDLVLLITSAPVHKDAPTDRPDERWSLDVIVIDPGHGGPDPGAEGVNGVYEKDVTLAIAQRLRDLLKISMPNTKVVMTRDTDVSIELYRRTQIANEARGKLFVSIHCNSMPTKPHPAHGCETYILRPGRNDDAARVAARENASVQYEHSTSRYSSMTEDQIIIATMAQRSFVRLSENLAATIQRQVATSTPMANRGVNQAGFFVLVGASMPNVLVETGFLSNTADAEYLVSSKGQKAIAASLAEAIYSFAAAYQQSLKH